MKFLGNNHLCRETQEWTDEAFTSIIGAPHCREIDEMLRCIVVVPQTQSSVRCNALLILL
jgi:hypothetical protein